MVWKRNILFCDPRGVEVCVVVLLEQQCCDPCPHVFLCISLRLVGKLCSCVVRMSAAPKLQLGRKMFTDFRGIESQELEPVVRMPLLGGSNRQRSEMTTMTEKNDDADDLTKTFAISENA